MNTEIFSQKNTQIINIQQKINASKLYIHSIQTDSQQNGECFLSFYPLAKNIRFISSYFFVNIVKGIRPILSSNARHGEDSFWQQKTGQNSWHPWLWSRNYQNNSTTKQSYENLFSPLERLINISDTTDSSESVDSFSLYLASLDHVFNINTDLYNKISNTIINNNLPSKICGLQIRRGEIATNKINNEGSWFGRKVYTIDEYMQGVKEICSILDTNNVFVSTDSDETVDHLKENYKDFNFFTNNYDTSLFIRYDQSWKQEFLDSPSLELQIAQKPELIEHYVNSCLSDLLVLSRCDGYVGGMNMSEYGICGWLLQFAKQKKITPFFNIEGNFEQNKLLLL